MVHHFTSCLPVNETMWPLLAPTSVTNPLSSLSLLVRRRPPAGSRATENMDSVVREKRNGHDTFIFSISTEMILFEFFLGVLAWTSSKMGALILWFGASKGYIWNNASIIMSKIHELKRSPQIKNRKIRLSTLLQKKTLSSKRLD